MENNLHKHKQDWEDLGEIDPFWAVLSYSEKKFGQWDVEEFFQTGVQEIGLVMNRVEEFGIPLERKVALDFGCGLGRLTRALAGYFEECYGVDISEKMITKAGELNQSVENCKFVLNEKADLQIFPDNYFDFIYTSVVLQHLPKEETIRSYISEFLRTLKNGGLIFFQLPSQISFKLKIKVSIRRGLYSSLKKIGINEAVIYRRGLHPIRMNSISCNEVGALLDSLGGKLLDSISVPVDSRVSTKYYVTKDN